jgi:MATE family multidrug resistance protein
MPRRDGRLSDCRRRVRNAAHARVLRIAVPIVVSNATVPILGAVDTGVVGQIGDPAPIGAVGMGAIILTAVYWIFGFCAWARSGWRRRRWGG